MISDQGDGFNLGPWGQNTDTIKGYDDGGKEYILPAEYEVASFQNQPGKGIFKGDVLCNIIIHTSGLPQLASNDPHNMPVLQLIEA